ncbi:hypothetical protein [Nonomuraea sp. NPDC050783]|uniref:hypothetical protein n=1 Tax=Nonomuraea sp. NPDC050783 TaxID=3154634 RepID=UPI00346685A8
MNDDSAQLVGSYSNLSWAQVPLEVTLKAGWNILRFQHRSWRAELNDVEVA